MTRHALAAILLLALAGCGFHLRNALMLPSDLGPLRVVSSNKYSPLGEALSEALTRAGAVPAPEDAENVATLNVVSERWGSLPLSVDARGRAQEYTLRYAVIFNMRRADGSDLVPQQAIELARDYISVPTRSSGTESEQEILSKEMRRDMVASILRRIDAIARMPAAQGQPVPAPPQTPPPSGTDTATPATSSATP